MAEVLFFADFTDHRPKEYWDDAPFDVINAEFKLYIVDCSKTYLPTLENHEQEWSFDRQYKIIKWCQETCEGTVGVDITDRMPQFHFNQESDAVLFVTTWC